MAHKWKDGWLWIQTVPDGKWIAATTNELIAALIERDAALEERVARLEQAMEQLKVAGEI